MCKKDACFKIKFITSLHTENKNKGTNIFKVMAKVKGAIVIDIQRCKGCQVCLAACPNSVIRMSVQVNSKGYNYAEPASEDCIGCANCAIVCPDGVITVYKTKVEQ